MVYDLIPKSLGWSIKVIGKTGSSQTTFVSAFLEFFIRYIVGIENIYYYQLVMKLCGIG